MTDAREIDARTKPAERKKNREKKVKHRTERYWRQASTVIDECIVYSIHGKFIGNKTTKSIWPDERMVSSLHLT